MSGISRARREAQRLLLGGEEAFAAVAQRAASDRLPKAERPLFREILGGVLRRRVTLRAILDRYLSRGVANSPAPMVTALEIGLYEILAHDGARAHATVNECVELARGGRTARGVVNGVLRKVLREAERIEEAPASPSRNVLVWSDRVWLFARPVLPDPERSLLVHLAIREGFLPEVARLLTAELGEEAAVDLMVRANDRVRPTLRMTARATTADALRDEVLAERPEAKLETLENHPAVIFRSEKLGDPASLPAFQEGRLTAQGPFAARVAPLLAPTSGERVLDLCAAPGGKSAHLLDLCPDLALTAAVLDGGAEKRTRATFERLGHQPEILRVQRDDPLPEGPWDAILLDVPCSNSGVLARRPEARRRLDEEHLTDLDRVQDALLDRALLAAGSTGARVVYATCSVLPRENLRRVEAALARHESLGYELGPTIEAFPVSAAEDGGFAACLQRRQG